MGSEAAAIRGGVARVVRDSTAEVRNRFSPVERKRRMEGILATACQRENINIGELRTGEPARWYFPGTVQDRGATGEGAWNFVGRGCSGIWGIHICYLKAFREKNSEKGTSVILVNNDLAGFPLRY